MHKEKNIITEGKLEHETTLIARFLFHRFKELLISRVQPRNKAVRSAPGDFFLHITPEQVQVSDNLITGIDVHCSFKNYPNMFDISGDFDIENRILNLSIEIATWVEMSTLIRKLPRVHELLVRTVRHELEHSVQDPKRTRRAAIRTQNLDIDHSVKGWLRYFSLQVEIEAFVSSFYKIAKKRKITMTEMLDEFFGKVEADLVDTGFSSSWYTQRIKASKRLWTTYAKKRFPNARW